MHIILMYGKEVRTFYYSRILHLLKLSDKILKKHLIINKPTFAA